MSKIILLEVSDGPEGIEIYADNDRGIIDWSDTFPAIYITVDIQGAHTRMGPFQLKGIFEGLKHMLLNGEEFEDWIKKDDKKHIK